VKLSRADAVGHDPSDDDWRNAGFGIYIHWPFCQSKCPYCDFNSHVSARVHQEQWCEAYLLELDRAAKATGGRIVDSVFFGGGTPSLMNPATVAAILDRIRRNWRPRNSWEVTLEANPSSVEAGRFEGYRDAGVNRVSIGLQSLSEDGLRDIGRLHSATEGRAAVEIAQRVFSRVSIDLIYGRQHQSPIEWRAELGQAIALGTDHLSLYQLTIEQNTAFHARLMAGGLAGLPSEDRAVELYELTQDLCSAAGFDAYEVSNHAKTDAESVHNCLYWQAGDYLGIGPGAHGRLTQDGTRFATEAERSPARWLEMVTEGGGQRCCEPLSRAERADEYLIMGLRLKSGISLDRLMRMLGHSIVLQHFKPLVDEGLVELEAQSLRATPRGRLLLNGVISELSAILDRTAGRH
jgi:putative oxygen-independent coproporphyrinogen III oxidase